MRGMRIIIIATLWGLGSLAPLTVALATDGEVAAGNASPPPVEVTADQSLEWYQDKKVYVARGNAKATRGDLVVDADTLIAHQMDKDATKGAPQPPSTDRKHKGAASASASPGGDIDRLTADGHVVITDPRQRITGDHAVYDLVQQALFVTGTALKYETEKEVVTARDSLEYWDSKHEAYAKGHAVAIRSDRHVEGDTLRAIFRVDPNGEQALSKMTGEGNVVVITKTDVARGDHLVYDANSNIAILSGLVRITRQNGMQLAGDVGEVNFTTNASRLLNQGGGRVRALLPSKSAAKQDGR